MSTAISLTHPLIHALLLLNYEATPQPVSRAPEHKHSTFLSHHDTHAHALTRTRTHTHTHSRAHAHAHALTRTLCRFTSVDFVRRRDTVKASFEAEKNRSLLRFFNFRNLRFRRQKKL